MKTVNKNCRYCKYCRRIETELRYNESSEDTLGGVFFKCEYKNEYIHKQLDKCKCRCFEILDGYKLNESLFVRLINKVFGK